MKFQNSFITITPAIFSFGKSDIYSAGFFSHRHSVSAGIKSPAALRLPVPENTELCKSGAGGKLLFSVHIIRLGFMDNLNPFRTYRLKISLLLVICRLLNVLNGFGFRNGHCLPFRLRPGNPFPFGF